MRDGQRRFPGFGFGFTGDDTGQIREIELFKPFDESFCVRLFGNLRQAMARISCASRRIFLASSFSFWVELSSDKLTPP
jgi:hypothetical protein